MSFQVVNALNKFGSNPINFATSNVKMSVNVLNIDKENSTLPVNKLILNDTTHTSIHKNGFIVSDADEELLILISFEEITNLKSLQIYALTNTIEELNDEMDISQPKEINIYKLNNLNINFDDLSCIKPDKTIKCKPKKLEKGQNINLQKASKFTKIKYLAIYIKSNQNGTENTFINGISFKKQETKKTQRGYGMERISEKDVISIKKWMTKVGYKISNDALTRMINDGFDKVEIMALIHKKNKADYIIEAAAASKSNKDLIQFTDNLQMNENEFDIDYNILWNKLLVFGFMRRQSSIDGFSINTISLNLIEIIIKFLGFLFEIDSVVVTENEKHILTNILIKNVIKKMKNPQKIQFNLLYRMSKDGGLKKFQSLCDNKNPLLFVFHSKFNHICGVFQSIPLKMKGGNKYDKYCFLFLLRSSFGHKPRVWRVTNDENDVIGKYNVVIERDKYYPSWGYAGMGNCLFVYKTDSYTMNSPTFQYESGNALLGGDKYYDKGHGDFRAGPIKEYEVYQIIVD
eukprot:21175_1